MPTENELKFVLRLDDKVEVEAKKLANSCQIIEQGYLRRKGKFCVRVRREETDGSTDLKHYLQVKLMMKHSVDFQEYLMSGSVEHTGSARQIEVGTEIDERDFLDFWKKTKGRIRKSRYYYQTDTTDRFMDKHGQAWKETWELDFFKKPDHNNYFVLAEIELPEGVTEPLFAVPELVRDNTVFQVPQGDSRFSNTRLGDRKYANRLYQSLFSDESEV